MSCGAAGRRCWALLLFAALLGGGCAVGLSPPRAHPLLERHGGEREASARPRPSSARGGHRPQLEASLERAPETRLRRMLRKVRQLERKSGDDEAKATWLYLDELNTWTISEGEETYEVPDITHLIACLDTTLLTDMLERADEGANAFVVKLIVHEAAYLAEHVWPMLSPQQRSSAQDFVASARRHSEGGVRTTVAMKIFKDDGSIGPLVKESDRHAHANGFAQKLVSQSRAADVPPQMVETYGVGLVRVNVQSRNIHPRIGMAQLMSAFDFDLQKWQVRESAAGHRPRDPEQVAAIGLDLALGLKWLHLHEVAHMDAKSDNAGLAKNPNDPAVLNALWLDFGESAQLTSKESVDDSYLNRPGNGFTRELTAGQHGSCNPDFGYRKPGGNHPRPCGPDDEIYSADLGVETNGPRPAISVKVRGHLSGSTHDEGKTTYIIQVYMAATSSAFFGDNEVHGLAARA